MGVSYIGLGVGMGGGAHASLIGEQAPLCTLADCSFQGVAEAAADNGLGLERILEDHAEGGGDVLDAGDQDHQTTGQEDRRHDGDHLLGDRSQPLDTAQEDNTADDHQSDPYRPGRNTESSLKGGADGIGLNHTAHKA